LFAIAFLQQRIPNFEKVPGKEVFSDGMIIDSDSLLVVYEMRRRVEASVSWETGPFSVSPEERLGECTGASFAFRTGDVDDVELADIGSLSQVNRIP
jgi:hypothetical protein